MIEVKGLRVGIYTVTELSNRASKDYIIPDAATVEIKADQTATVQFFNEKPEEPETPDDPKTPSSLPRRLIRERRYRRPGMTISFSCTAAFWRWH